MKIIEKVLERRLQGMVKVDEMQFGFIPGKGNIYSWLTNKGNTKTRWTYPHGKNLLFSNSYEGGKASVGNLITFIRNDVNKERKLKYENFVADKSDGLTKVYRSICLLHP